MKKVLSLLLSLVMLFSVLSGISLNAYATDKTATQAINWVVSKVGTQIDVDGAYPGECVDLIMAYYEYLGVSRPFGNGKDYASNALPSGWNRYQGAQPQKGDILVYTTGTYGHVAIYVDDSLTYHQNYNGIKTVQPVNGRYNSIRDGYWGVIRPNFASDYINLGDSFYAYIIKQDGWKHLANEGGNVQLASKGNDCFDPKQIWHFLRQTDGTYKIVNEYAGSCLDAFNWGNTNGSNVGVNKSNDTTAQRWKVVYNGQGLALSPSYCDLVLDVENNSNSPGANAQLFEKNGTNAQIFSIYKLTQDGLNYVKPERPNKINVTASVTKNQVNINWSKAEANSKFDNRIYDVRIYKDSANSTPIYTKKDLTNTSYHYLLQTEGTYYVTVAAVNNKYYEYFTFSDAVSFKIEKSAVCTHSWNDGTVTKPATYAATGVKTYTCTKCGETKTETIPKLEKKANPIVAKGKTATVKYSKLKKKAQTVAQKNAFSVSKAQGKVTYTKSSGNKKITVSKAGKITVKKGLKKGTYKVKIKVKAAGNTKYKAATKTVTVTIKVK